MDTGLGGWVVVVTGASGGIGDAVAGAFADEGARLVLHANSRGDALTRRAEAADVTSEELIQQIFDKLPVP